MVLALASQQPRPLNSHGPITDHLTTNYIFNIAVFEQKMWSAFEW